MTMPAASRSAMHACAASSVVSGATGPVTLNGPGESLFDGRNDPGGEVADVDQLHRRVGRTGEHHRLVARRALDPRIETIAPVVRTDDEAGTNRDGPFRHRRFGRRLARGFELAVELQVQDVRIGVGRQDAEASGLVGARRLLGVNADRRNEHVPLDRVAQKFGRIADVARNVAARVDDGIETTAAKSRRPSRFPVICSTPAIVARLPRLNAAIECPRACASSMIARPRKRYRQQQEIHR